MTTRPYPSTLWFIDPNTGLPTLEWQRFLKTLYLNTGTVSATTGGIAPPSGGGTSTFLRADGKWAVPSGTGISSFNARTGAITLGSSDVTGALGFTPYNATNPSGYQTASQVSTAIAAGNASNVSGTVVIANGGTGATSAAAALTALGAAPIASPSFTGAVAVPSLMVSGSAAGYSPGAEHGTIGWNFSSLGEVDFFNTSSTATRAFSWQQWNGSAFTEMMRLSATGNLTVNGSQTSQAATQVAAAMSATGLAADVGRSQVIAYSGGLTFSLVNDAQTVANNWLSVGRSGATPTTLSFSGTGASFAMPVTILPATAPATPASGIVLYVDSADGKMKAMGSSGTVTTLALP